MENNRVSISSIVENQLPSFVKEDYPLVSEFLKEYYKSLEQKGSSYDIIQNIDYYIKVNNLTNLVESTRLISDVSFSDTIIEVNSTEGFPNSYGLIFIDSEIILYKSKTSTTFEGCYRGFSGITEYSSNNSEDFTFSTTETEEHLSESTVKNLSSLFLKEFFNKVKKQFLFGFDDRNLSSGLNENLFLKQSKDFYTSKGTDRSFEILFRVLYGKDVEVILPEKYLIRPSDAEYRVTRNFVVESIQGNPEDLLNKTIFQNEYENIPKSYGTVTDVQKIIKDNKEYYTLMLDYDFNKDIIVSGSIFGELNIHPKTVIINDVKASDTTIIVDSTIGFPKSGEILISIENQNYIINYNGKTINQFLNCANIPQNIPSKSEIYVNTYAFGYSGTTNEEIRFRITGVISDVEDIPKNFYYEKGDIGKILSLGYNNPDLKDNTWLFNTEVLCEVKNFTNDGEFKYTIETFDRNGIYEGDSVEIDYINASTGKRNIDIVNNVKIPSGSIPNKIFQIQTSFDISKIFTVKKVLSTFKNKFVSDILNVYRDFDNEDVYVASSSLPFYGTDLNSIIEDYKINLNGDFSGETLKIVNDNENHGYITGDAIVYSYSDNDDDYNFNIQPGVYYVRKISDTEIKLARSRSDINANKYVSVAATTVSNNKLSLLRFSKIGNIPSTIDSQKIIRLISSPKNTGVEYDTLSGTTGILVNGVEILNYKSEDRFYYGPIENIEIISPGNNLDVINPPVLEISSESYESSSASGYCGVEGSLKKINILDSGFDYIDTPIIDINGGGGFGASAIPKMIEYDHYVNLNPTSSNGRINLIDNEIGFSTYHKFRDGESVVYDSGNNTSIGGLTNESVYYIKVIDDYKVKLHKNEQDSLVGINTIDITSYGKGNHKLKSTVRKRKINSIIVTNPGQNYKNKKIEVQTSGINTSNNTINVYKHPYFSGETIYYYGAEENISGLDTGSYIVTKISNSSFKLSNIGIGNTSRDFYYKTKQYINLTSSGIGTHIFNYEPIEVKVIGKVGVSTITNVDLTAKLQPVFRGTLKSVFIKDGGVGYGSSTILNYNKQPSFNLNAGYGSIVTPIVSSGKIIDVIVDSKGSGYNSPPDLIVRGFGVGAILTPIIKNGQIISVKVINGGINYDQKNTSIEVSVPLSGYELKSYAKTWTVNIFNRLFESKKISSDDSVVYSGLNKNYGTQYTHLYSPRTLRKKVFASNSDDGKLIYKQDYQNDFDDEKYHSPLIGWAYDGNPIYGPYGYDSPSNKNVRQILSGYSDPIDSQENRPSKKLFPAGYFVEDYSFNNSGDLDRHNGRFCVTPEYPNGIYAYFMTLDSEISNDVLLPFSGDKRPKFPYIIGNTFKSKPINFNFSVESNQDNFNFENKNIVRNTYPYNTLSNNSFYEYFTKTSLLSSQNTKVTNTSKGSIESFKIISGGNNYKVNDRIIFNNSNTGGIGAAAKVSKLKGKKIVSISQTSTTVTDVEFYPSSVPNRMIGLTSNPHLLSNNDLIFINSLSDYDKSLQNQFNVGVRTERFILNLGIENASSTGIVTYFYVSGNLDFPSIRENDILTINNEDIKVLNIDKKTSRIRVLREQNSTVSSAHSAYSILYDNPRKFTINLNNDVKNKKYNSNKVIYFNPKESLGIGSFVGFGHTITFSNPGVGKTQILIPEKTIYIPNHKLLTGNRIEYKVNNGNSISVSADGISTFKLSENSSLYVVKITNDLIGISTIKVGLGSTGEYEGIYQNGSSLFFTDSGSGLYHSFTTDLDNVSKGNVTKNIITVSTGTTHLLKRGDEVEIKSFPGISTSINILYSDYHRRIIVNPRNFSYVDTSTNLITMPSHGYTNGQKLIHTSPSPCIGLEDNQIYYAIVYDENRIKLSKTYYDSTNKLQIPINIQSSSYGTLSQINPKISIVKNKNVSFNLSNSSLSQKSSGDKRISSFDFKLFLDSNFTTEYLPINIDGTSKIKSIGNIGIDTDAKVEFKVDDDFPNQLYYTLIPKTDLNLKSEIIFDDEVIENNKISFVKSKLNGTKTIVGVTSSTFDFYNDYTSEKISYLDSDGEFSYITNSSTEIGEINDIDILSGGKSYQNLPFISSITSRFGSGAIILPQSESIGKIISNKILDIGFNYPIDKTLKPLVKFPNILRVEPLSNIESIRVNSPGENYNIAPEFVVIDGFTNEVVDDISLEYNLGDEFIKILKNSKGLYGVTPKIIPIKNSNGISVNSVTYDENTKNVSVIFKKQFSDLESFPFSIGDEILVEGISVTGSGNTSKGYNSSSYNYSTFPVVGVDTNLGGFGAGLIYSMENYLNSGESPGLFDSDNSSGIVVSKSSFPNLEINLTKNSFILGEKIFYDDNVGKVLKWDSKNEYLTIETTDNFLINALFVGESSKSQAFIREVFETETFYNIKASSIVSDGWNRNTGFLNDNLQRLQDSDYYQYFSYSLKSEVSFSDWNDVVSNLNHTLGFKKFSDLVLNSTPDISSGISTVQDGGFVSATADLNSVVNVDCVYDFDLVSENSFYIQGELSSDEIIFNSAILQDYSESTGNRVLLIDDISQDFNTSVTKTFVTSFNI